MNNRSSIGFTVVEVLVALAIIAGGFLALIDLKISLNRQLARQERSISTIIHETSALAALRKINPDVERHGEREIAPTVVMYWHATPIAGPAPHIEWLGGETNELITLYRVHYEVKQNRRRISDGQIDLVGWSRSAS